MVHIQITIDKLVRFIVSPTITFILSCDSKQLVHLTYLYTWGSFWRLHGTLSHPSQVISPDTTHAAEGTLCKIEPQLPVLPPFELTFLFHPCLATFPTPLFHLIATSYHLFFPVFLIISYTRWHNKKTPIQPAFPLPAPHEYSYPMQLNLHDIGVTIRNRTLHQMHHAEHLL